MQIKRFKKKIRYYLNKKHIEWENACKKCGLCCYEKEHTSHGIIINLKKPCTYLNIETKECTIYLKRFNIYNKCAKMTVFHAFFSRYLPKTCGYIQKYRKWQIFSFPHLND